MVADSVDVFEDLHPDGKRFLMIKPLDVTAPENARSPKINIVLNWTEELKRILAAGGVRGDDHGRGVEAGVRRTIRHVHKTHA